MAVLTWRHGGTNAGAIAFVRAEVTDEASVILHRYGLIRSVVLARLFPDGSPVEPAMSMNHPTSRPQPAGFLCFGKGACVCGSFG
jgi:hypothetical protein